MGLSVALGVAGAGAEGGVAAVVMVAATLAALAGLASSAASSESGCFCVRVHGRIPSASSGLVAGTLKAERSCSSVGTHLVPSFLDLFGQLLGLDPWSVGDDLLALALDVVLEFERVDAEAVTFADRLDGRLWEGRTVQNAAVS